MTGESMVTVAMRSQDIGREGAVDAA